MEIRNYILEHPRQTENQIAQAMSSKGICSRITTLKKIGELKERRIIEDVRSKPNSFSSLVVRDTNEYNFIYRELSKIEKLVDAVEKQSELIRKIPIRDLRAIELYSSYPREVQSKLIDEIVDCQRVLVRKFLHPYNDTISLILSTLLYLTRKKIPSEKDSQGLYKKIIQLMVRFYPLGSLLDDEVDLNSFIDDLNDSIPVSAEKYAKKIGVDLELRRDVAKYVNEFSKSLEQM